MRCARAATGLRAQRPADPSVVPALLPNPSLHPAGAFWLLGQLLNKGRDGLVGEGCAVLDPLPPPRRCPRGHAVTCRGRAPGLEPLSPELVVKVMYECSLGLDHMGNTHSLYTIPGVRFASCTEEGV